MLGICIRIYIRFIKSVRKENRMKKIFIVVRTKYSTHKICTEDLSKMYYFHKRACPKLPHYHELSDSDESLTGAFTGTKKITK